MSDVKAVFDPVFGKPARDVIHIEASRFYSATVDAIGLIESNRAHDAVVILRARLKAYQERIEGLPEIESNTKQGIG